MAQEHKHTVAISSREHAEITGVTEVGSFDEQTVVLSTVCGDLTLEGEGLHVGTLDMARGVVIVEGKIGALHYEEAVAPRRGLRARLFG